MSAGGAKPAGSSLRMRLDPLFLPVSFHAADAGTDVSTRIVKRHRESVVLQRSVCGMCIEISLPITAFLGIVMRLVPPVGTDPGAIAIMLEHRDPVLSMPLFTARHACDALAEWHMWARFLGLPLLVADDDGQLRAPFRNLEAIRISDPRKRIRRRRQLRRSRPNILHRKAGRRGAPAIVYHEREIIARN